MAKIDLEAQLEANKGAAEYASVIRQTLESLDELRSKGVPSRQYSLTPPFKRGASVPSPNQSKIPILPRSKITLGA